MAITELSEATDNLNNFEETYEDRVRQMVAIGFVLAQSENIGTLKQAFMIGASYAL